MKKRDLYDIAWSAGRDAGDRNMRKASRKIWSKDDYNTAIREYRRIVGAAGDVHYRRMMRDHNA